MKILFVFALVLAWSSASFAGQTETNQDKKVIGLNIGNKAPDITEKGIDGKDITLSSLKGKLVLIDFWASWCPPCRRENPTVVGVYNQYKDSKFKNGSGYTVFSVSLDKDKAAWEEAIITDKLTWEYHVSDLKGWYSKYAGIYEVRGIPSNFLIDGEGVIIGKDLRGPALENAIKSFLK